MNNTDFLGLDLPEDVAAQVADERAREEAQQLMEQRTKSIIDSMAFDVYSGMVAVASGKPKPIPYEALVDKSFLAVEGFVKVAGMRDD